MPTSFIDKVKSTIKKYKMLQKGDRVLVGLSGGADSVTLLQALLNFKKEYALELFIAHLDHSFRGEESQGDSKFCEDLGKKLGIETFCEKRDVPKIVKEKGISPEEAARQERYDLFTKIARHKKIKKIAVGHTRDDQAETVLMRAIRGAGMAGLGGISPVKDMAGFTVIRPLIELSRKDIEGFIKGSDLKFRHDSTNDEVVFTRNRVRHELIPYIEDKFNSNVKEVLANMAEALRIENEFLEKYAKRKLKSVSKKSKNGEITIDIKRFKKQPEAIQKRILRSALEGLKGNLRRLTYQHWREMDELIQNRPVNSVVDLPEGIDIIKDRNGLVLKKRPSCPA
ncbi:MAG: tRNA lysidine(34) synthetase TilS [Candidatus Omnitrophica bacterium]|nr:tRNA lysidine(34) synthetase TilS [Candidatus Omnitrophota bacterium]